MIDTLWYAKQTTFPSQNSEKSRRKFCSQPVAALQVTRYVFCYLICQMSQNLKLYYYMQLAEW